MAPIPRPVLAEGIAFLQEKADEPLDLEDLLAKDDEVRAQFARFVNASPEEIGLIFSTSEGEHTRAWDLVAGDNVVIDDLHYLAEVGSTVRWRRRRASSSESLNTMAAPLTRVTSSPMSTNVHASYRWPGCPT